MSVNGEGYFCVVILYTFFPLLDFILARTSVVVAGCCSFCCKTLYRQKAYTNIFLTMLCLALSYRNMEQKVLVSFNFFCKNIMVSFLIFVLASVD